MARAARTRTPTDAVRYLLDGKVRTVSGVEPTRTVLQHLREDLGRTGTKEGCAEGDCGACTVVLAELDGRRVRYRAINSCIQFVPTLDGKALVTVEGLKDRRSGALHPVQAAMADGHGSQCGFCTPGFVMSLFALYKTDPAPDRIGINDALAGNLCRCTGYRPIVDAARTMYGLGRAIPERDQDWCTAPARSRSKPAAESEAGLARALKALRRRKSLVLEAPRRGVLRAADRRRACSAPRAPARGAHPRRRHGRRPVGDQAAPAARRHPVRRGGGRPAADQRNRGAPRHRRGGLAHRCFRRDRARAIRRRAKFCAASRRRRSATPARSPATSRTARRSAIRCRR